MADGKQRLSLDFNVALVCIHLKNCHREVCSGCCGSSFLPCKEVEGARPEKVLQRRWNLIWVRKHEYVISRWEPVKGERGGRENRFKQNEMNSVCRNRGENMCSVPPRNRNRCFGEWLGEDMETAGILKAVYTIQTPAVEATMSRITEQGRDMTTYAMCLNQKRHPSSQAKMQPKKPRSRLSKRTWVEIFSVQGAHSCQTAGSQP